MDPPEAIVPSLPLSLPASTIDLVALAQVSQPSQHLRGKRDDLHEASCRAIREQPAQKFAFRSGSPAIVQYHGRVAVKADSGAIGTADLFGGA